MISGPMLNKLGIGPFSDWLLDVFFVIMGNI